MAKYKKHKKEKFNKKGGAKDAQMAQGIADMHDFEGRPSIAHTDITLSQFILVDGSFKLNDFNPARFMRWNITRNEPCGFTSGKTEGQ